MPDAGLARWAVCVKAFYSGRQPVEAVAHGLVGVLMPDERFLRIDPRGNKPGIDARFIPSRESLAFEATSPGEIDLPGVFTRPVPAVVAALSGGHDWHPVDTKLPDIRPEHWPEADAEWCVPAR